MDLQIRQRRGKLIVGFFGLNNDFLMLLILINQNAW